MRKKFVLLVVGMLALPAWSSADVVDVTVTVENLAPTDSVSFAPLRLGFHRGIYDAFDEGESPGPAIVSIAEGGSGDQWFPAFSNADPTAVLGTVVNGGPAVPAGNAGMGNPFSSTASATFRVDTDVNQFFTFANMVVPSNDLFLGNDERIQLFDDSGNLLINSITQTGGSIWNAGSELAILENGAFVVGGNNSQREGEFGAVEFSFSELDVFDGAETAAGYFFNSGAISSDTEIYRITFSANAVPEPGSAVLLCVGLAGVAFRRRR